MRLLLTILGILLLATQVAAVVNTTGSITLENTNGQLTAGVQPSNSISVTFTAPSIGSGGAGGGGTLSNTTNVCLDEMPESSHSYDQMEAGRRYTIKPLTEEFAIREFSFELAKNVTNDVTFTLSHILHIQCETVPEVTGREVLAYEGIDYVGIPSNTILPGVKITFRVSDKELENAAPGDLQLLRYEAGNWNPLPLEKVKGDPGYHTFIATSPGLSRFALTLPAKEVPAEENQMTGDVVGKPTTESTSQQTTQQTTQPTEKSEPEERGESSAPTKGGTGFLWSLLIVVVIGGALGIYYYQDYQKKVAEVNANAQQQTPQKETSLIGRVEIGEEALKDPVEKLRDYVDREMRQGFKRQEIAAELRKSGWPENIITSVLDNFSKAYMVRRGMHGSHDDYTKVLSFLKEKLDLGYDIAVVKRIMVKNGWDASLIDSLLKELHVEQAAKTAVYAEDALAKLRSFIATEQAKGYSKEQIKAALLKSGWQEGVVDEELQK